jgi:hypothetical protein
MAIGAVRLRSIQGHNIDAAITVKLQNAVGKYPLVNRSSRLS